MTAIGFSSVYLGNSVAMPPAPRQPAPKQSPTSGSDSLAYGIASAVLCVATLPLCLIVMATGCDSSEELAIDQPIDLTPNGVPLDDKNKDRYETIPINYNFGNAEKVGKYIGNASYSLDIGFNSTLTAGQGCFDGLFDAKNPEIVLPVNLTGYKIDMVVNGEALSITQPKDYVPQAIGSFCQSDGGPTLAPVNVDLGQIGQGSDTFNATISSVTVYYRVDNTDNTGAYFSNTMKILLQTKRGEN